MLYSKGYSAPVLETPQLVLIALSTPVSESDWSGGGAAVAVKNKPASLRNKSALRESATAFSRLSLGPLATRQASSTRVCCSSPDASGEPTFGRLSSPRSRSHYDSRPAPRSGKAWQPLWSGVIAPRGLACSLPRPLLSPRLCVVQRGGIDICWVRARKKFLAEPPLSPIRTTTHIAREVGVSFIKVDFVVSTCTLPRGY